MAAKKRTPAKAIKEKSVTTPAKKRPSRAKKIDAVSTEPVEKKTNIPQLEKPVEKPIDNKNKTPFKMRRSQIIAVIAILAIIGLLYYFRNLIVVATVNNQPISRWEYNKQLEQQSGKEVMNSLVTKTLIEQEANKEHVTVSDAEVNTEIKKVQADLSKQGQSLDQALTLRGLSMDDLKDQIRIQKLIEKMLGKDITVSDSEVNDYIQKNQIAQDSQTGTPPLSPDAVRQQLQQQKLNAKFTPWLQKLQEKAKINYFVKV